MNSVEIGHRRDVQGAVCRGNRRADGNFEFYVGENLLFLGGSKYPKCSASCSEINLPVRDQWRRPNFAFNFMRPMRLASAGIDTMELPAAICNEDEAIMNRGRGHHVTFEPVRPNLSRAGNVAGLGCVNALEPRLIFAPEKVAAARDVDTIPVKDRHSVDVARAFAPIGVVTMDIFLRRARIEIELPDFLQLLRTFTRHSVRRAGSTRNRFKRLNDPVASSEEDQRSALDFAQRWR